MDAIVVTEILSGACEMIAQAGANLVGGHSIDDDTLKFGLSVMGFVSPQRIWTNAGAQIGDRLILTKALGTGTLTAALKRGAVTEADIEDAIFSMCQLNRVVQVLPLELQLSIHAATDITGFGLSGHSMQMAIASQLSFELKTPQLPRFEKTLDCLEKEFLTKAHRTNREYTSRKIQTHGLISLEELLIHDPQTSGGAVTFG